MKKIREINSLVNSLTLLVKTLLSRKFCQKCLRVNFTMSLSTQLCSYSNPCRPEFIWSNSSRLRHSSQGGIEVANLLLVDVITCGHISVTGDEIRRLYSSQRS